MNDACACFTTDLGYMFPSLLSAIQARKHLDADKCDVVIILFTRGEVVDDVFNAACRQKGIVLITADLGELQGHTTMYARLFLNKLLPPAYTRILYIDGDVQITASLNPLIQADLPEDRFSAVADPMCVTADQAIPEAEAVKAYFRSLNVQNTLATPYFNSGVLLINRASWAEICDDALTFLNEHPELCRFQDQSALNFAGHQKMTPMSFQWNFPIFFRNCGVERRIRPAIYHFMSKPKPWNGVFPPWNKHFFMPYVELLREYPALAAHSKPMPLKSLVKYAAQQRVKQVQETFSWRLSGRRRGILAYHEAASR
jgi:lipopolysaccharide biosynthesis glycosyltransferase